MTENSHSHRDRLAAFHARRADHLTTASGLIAQAQAGDEVDLAEITAAEAAADLITRLLPSATTLAQAEEHAEAMTAWGLVEAAALGDHHRLAADFHDRHDRARTALADLVAAGLRLNRSLSAYVDNPARPAAVLAAVHPVLAGEVRATALGQRMHAAPNSAAVAALAAEAMSTTRRAGEPVPTSTAAALQHLALDLMLPVDPRGTGDETPEVQA